MLVSKPLPRTETDFRERVAEIKDWLSSEEGKKAMETAAAAGTPMADRLRNARATAPECVRKAKGL